MVEGGGIFWIFESITIHRARFYATRSCWQPQARNFCMEVVVEVAVEVAAEVAAEVTSTMGSKYF